MLNLKECRVRLLIRQGKLQSTLLDGHRRVDKASLYSFIRINIESMTHL